MGDTDILENARKKSEEFNKSLLSVMEFKKINSERKKEVQKILGEYKTFYTSAQNTYLLMSKGETNDTVTQDAMRLGKQTTLIEDELNNLKSSTAQDLKDALQNISDSTKKLRYLNLYVFLGVVGISIFVISVILRRFISKPIRDTVLMIKDMAEGGGDLTSRLKTQSNDEIGDLVRWFNLFLEKLQAMVRNIVGNADNLNRASSELAGLSNQMSEGANEMSAKTNSVAVSSEQMTSNMDSVASAMEESSGNMDIIASSVEEMTATINEIANNSEKARNITGDSVNKAQKVSVQVNKLGKAAQEIGKVTETISEISEQTNLLALNATIEAATVINDVNDIVTTIATAVEEQSVTTNEIAGNVMQASQGIQTVNLNISEGSSVLKDIAREVTEVNLSSSEITNSSSQVYLSAGELEKLAEQLNKMVNKFKV